MRANAAAVSAAGESAMTVTYDPLLIGLSIVIAIVGSYSGLQLARRLTPKSGPARKALLSAAAVTIGGAIWSMHFVGMLALELPVVISYDVLLTLVSALVSILVTGVGLFIASYGEPTRRKIGLAGVFMGLGISSMHYIGMAAVRANCIVTYAWELVAASVLIGIAASTFALWLAFRLKSAWQTVAAGAVMGLAIAGMHYTAMAAASFLPVDVLIDYAAPALSPHLLAIVVAVAAFLLFGFALLIALPDRPREAVEYSAADADASASALAEGGDGVPGVSDPERLAKLPVVKNKATLLLDLNEVISIQAESHYTRVFNGQESYFCSFSLSDLEARLDPTMFLRVHRSHIVNLRHAKSFERRREQGVIRLDGQGTPSVPVSRRNVPKLRAALGLQS